MIINGEDIRLPKVFKAKWVKALRSGKYKQGTGSLHSSNNNYCCLGVACQVMYPKQEIKGNYIYEKEYSKIPKMLCGDNENEIVKKLSTMNDGTGAINAKIKSFDYIASYIERYL